jgi:hypothetical protein
MNSSTEGLSFSGIRTQRFNGKSVCITIADHRSPIAYPTAFREQLTRTIAKIHERGCDTDAGGLVCPNWIDSCNGGVLCEVVIRFLVVLTDASSLQLFRHPAVHAAG